MYSVVMHKIDRGDNEGMVLVLWKIMTRDGRDQCQDEHWIVQYTVHQRAGAN